MQVYELTREDKVSEFREAAGQLPYFHNPDGAELVFDCIEEEYIEFVDAALDFEENENEDTRAALYKEWADLQYVVSQAAVFYNIPAQAAFNRVHNSNMTKVVDGKVIYREDGKVLKPDTYVPADMRGL